MTGDILAAIADCSTAYIIRMMGVTAAVAAFSILLIIGVKKNGGGR